MAVVDIGIFAHNEAGTIAATLKDCLAQTVFNDAGIDIRLVVLANGCTDDTAAVSEAFLNGCGRPQLEVEALREGGKSRTWNRFVHDISRPHADYLIFCDADIAMPDHTVLAKLLSFIAANAQLVASPSRPVKSFGQAKERPSLVQRLIASSAGGLDDWKTAICGQLYIARASSIRSIWLPVGLPVEDGFIRAMILTDNFRMSEDVSRINGDEEVWHLYESETTLSALIRHQIRIVIGSAINMQLFRRLEEEPIEGRQTLMKRAAADEHWLGALLSQRLPRAPYGWVPFHFLIKRIQRFAGSKQKSVRAAALALAGFGFDMLVFVLAQWRMANGTGANFW